jgi:hypothetical protein
MRLVHGESTGDDLGHFAGEVAQIPRIVLSHCTETLHKILRLQEEQLVLFAGINLGYVSKYLRFRMCVVAISYYE